jgi:hypothetical protein
MEKIRLTNFAGAVRSEAHSDRDLVLSYLDDLVNAGAASFGQDIETFPVLQLSSGERFVLGDCWIIRVR